MECLETKSDPTSIPLSKSRTIYNLPSFLCSPGTDPRYTIFWDLGKGFPGSSEVKSICLQCGRPGFDPWVRKIHWRRKWQPTTVFLPGESHRQRSLVGYSPWGHQESDMTEQLHDREWNNSIFINILIPMEQRYTTSSTDCTWKSFTDDI